MDVNKLHKGHANLLVISWGAAAPIEVDRVMGKAAIVPYLLRRRIHRMVYAHVTIAPGDRGALGWRVGRMTHTSDSTEWPGPLGRHLPRMDYEPAWVVSKGKELQSVSR